MVVGTTRMLVIQNSIAPANIRHALVDLAGNDTTDLRIASAYVTRSGSNVLLNAVGSALGEEAFAAIPKLLVTSFDFGLTDPIALRDWLDLDNALVMVAGVSLLEDGSLIPTRAFHPKMYAFGKHDATYNVLVGSANLTGRGLSVNAEAAWSQHDVPSGQVDAAFARTRHETLELTTDILAAYQALRQQRPPPPELEPETQPVEPPAPLAGAQLPLFRIAIETGALNPAAYNSMWIHGEGLQGGSRNQLELPRGAHTFFGFQFDQYEYPHNLTIGEPLLRSAGRVWDNRPLTWHGNNRMERLNLPTLAQGGFNYADTAVMFRRLPDQLLRTHRNAVGVRSRARLETGLRSKRSAIQTWRDSNEQDCWAHLGKGNIRVHRPSKAYQYLPSLLHSKPGQGLAVSADSAGGPTPGFSNSRSHTGRCNHVSTLVLQEPQQNHASEPSSCANSFSVPVSRRTIFRAHSRQ